MKISDISKKYIKIDDIQNKQDLTPAEIALVNKLRNEIKFMVMELERLEKIKNKIPVYDN